MTNYLSSFNEDVLKNAISLSSFQDMLINATQQLLENILQTIESIFFVSKQSTIPQLVHLLFIASEYRYLKVPYYCYILQKIIETHQDELLTAKIKKSLLHSFIQPATIHNARCFFIRSCMKTGILTPEEIVDTIHKHYLMRPSNPDRLIYSFCWFCPEIESLNNPLFNTILTSFNQNVQSGMIIPMFANFLRIFEPLSSNNWQIYHTCCQYGFNPDRYAIIICRDEVEVLKTEFEKSNDDPNEYVIPECVFDCTHILSESKPSLLQVAAYFGSMKCFDYLLSIGSDIRFQSDQRHSLLMFAVAGGSLEMIKKVIAIEEEKAHHKVNMNKVLETAARFHQNEVFYFLLDRSIKNRYLTSEREYYQLIINDCVISNNLSLLIKSLEKGVDINHSDICNVFNSIFF